MIFMTEADVIAYEKEQEEKKKRLEKMEEERKQREFEEANRQGWCFVAFMVFVAICIVVACAIII